MKCKTNVKQRMKLTIFISCAKKHLGRLHNRKEDIEEDDKVCRSKKMRYNV